VIASRKRRKENRTLLDAYDRFRDERLDVSRNFLENLRTTLKHFHNANGGEIPIDQLAGSHVRAMMRYVSDKGRTARTVNNFRRNLLILWNNCLDWNWPIPPLPRRSEIRKLKEAAPLPTAWRPEQMEAIVTACRQARMKRGWGGMHWEALVMAVYDTSVRVGALMKSDLSQVDPDRNTLFIPGEFHKARRATFQPLRSETCGMLLSLPRVPGDTRLFPWPYSRDELWRKFRTVILEPAGLPATHRDYFHKIRRTSYTMIAKAYGVTAASDHASHAVDMSAHYLDKSFLDRPDPIKALPLPVQRPQDAPTYRIGADPRDWDFAENAASYCNRWIDIPSKPAVTLLRQFVARSGGPMSWQEIMVVIYGGAEHGWKDVKHRAEQYVDRLRKWIRSGLGLGKGFQPFIEKNGSYTLCLPVFS